MPYPKLNKVVFLDRDGTLNHNGDYYVFKKDRFFLNEGVLETLKELYNKGYKLIVISNQSGIAKGLYTVDEVNELHTWFNSILKNEGIEIVEFYYCTHHPDYGKCLCRKPQSLLIEKAISRFNISVEESYFIGDSQRDVDAAVSVGLIPILIEPNSNLRQVLNLIP